MKRVLQIFFLSMLITACQHYYLKSNLNNIAIGQSKAELLKMFTSLEGVPPMQIRAAQQDGDSLVEVGEILMTDGVSLATYWFLFENGSLMQWGQSTDWKEVQARYEINYNPSPSVEPSIKSPQ